tara:strand:+ start:376 stop:954 length:579 start_codon:yes stop_codon:yes gene_type:complete
MRFRQEAPMPADTASPVPAFVGAQQSENSMNRRVFLTTALGASLALIVGQHAGAQQMDATTQSSFDTVMAFMGAMGSGDSAAVASLMAEDMVWHNEGDPSLPWIGVWDGKARIFEFMGIFGGNFQTTAWTNTDAFAAGDTVAVFGTMNAITTQSGRDTGEFTFALRAKVRDGKVILWHWFEDSFAVSRAYHG